MANIVGKTVYKVVVNCEEQFSIWPVERENPTGWDDAGKVGTKDECLSYVKDTWTDMRPLSLRRQQTGLSPGFSAFSPTPSTFVSIIQFIEDQATKTPHADAIIAGEHSISYRTLNNRANQVAHQLREMGAGPEITIGLFIERSIEMVVGLLGILKSGGVYVPLDPEYPQRRLQTVIQIARIQIVLTQAHLVKEISPPGAKILLVDKDWPIISRHGTENISHGLSPANLSHIIFTSGSTGTPKGAMVAHESLCNNALSLRDRLGITSRDIYLQTASIAFTSSLRQLLVPLSAGAAVVIASAEQRKNPLALFNLIKQKNVTIFDTVASFWENFMHILSDMGAREKNLLLNNHLRMILSSGGELPTRIPNNWRNRLDQQSQIVNMYGQAETIGNIMVYPISALHGFDTETVPLGSPIDNIEVYLVTDQLNPVDAGTDAEICIGGPYLARGYINQPDLTAEKFVPNPFSKTPGDRLYRTGDMGRLSNNALIEFAGRIDFQLSIRGFRIEPGEIESVLKKHASIVEAVVVARDDIDGGKRLVAHVVHRSDSKPTIDQLHELLSASLPDYMVPSVFVMLDELPRLPNGKIDRRSLPEPERKRPDLGQAYAPPSGPLQQYLVNLWSEILKLDKVGIHDRFFELGGTSLLAARFVNRLQADLDEFIYILSVFESPTIDEYADFLKTNFPHCIEDKFPDEFADDSGNYLKSNHAKPTSQLKPDAIFQMRHYIPATRVSEAVDCAEELKNPPAIFILSPPRSGTTLLRLMLAENGNFLVANELQLLGFFSLPDRKLMLSENYDWWMDGSIQSIMSIMRCDRSTARKRLEEYEQAGMTTKEFYRLMQERIESRILVDASSTYAFDTEILRKAENDFENPLFIHFISHPFAMIQSFQSSSIAEKLYLFDHPFNTRELGELLWIISHQNITEFLNSVPTHRKFQVRLEDLMTRPQEIVKALCRTFNMEDRVNMTPPIQNIRAFPFQSSEARVVSNSDYQLSGGNYLSDIAWEIAEMYGYPRNDTRQQEKSGDPPTDTVPQTNARKQFIDQQRQRRVAYRMRRAREGRLNEH